MALLYPCPIYVSMYVQVGNTAGGIRRRLGFDPTRHRVVVSRLAAGIRRGPFPPCIFAASFAARNPLHRTTDITGACTRNGNVNAHSGDPLRRIRSFFIRLQCFSPGLSVCYGMDHHAPIAEDPLGRIFRRPQILPGHELARSRNPPVCTVTRRSTLANVLLPSVASIRNYSSR
jgi:hypothetical protein